MPQSRRRRRADLNAVAISLMAGVLELDGWGLNESFPQRGQFF
jgi:hypothetical protein